MRWSCLVVLCLIRTSSLAAGEPDGAELVSHPRCVAGAREPVFEELTAEQLARTLRVVSSRSYAVIGFNNPEVQIGLPRCDNSVYASVEFAPIRLLDPAGREVPYQPERGIYDHDTHSDELRFAPVEGDRPVEFDRVEGVITLRYPVRMRTLSVRPGDAAPQGLSVAIEGPFVAWSDPDQVLTEAASFTPVEQLRAFDAKGRRLERHSFKGYSMRDGVETEKNAYWGEVAEIRIDLVEQWVELEISYALPSVKPLPTSRVGTPPESDERVPTPGGRVEVRITTRADPESRTASGEESREATLARLRELGFRRFDANSFLLAATRGKAEALKLFLAAGMPVDTVSGGRTALMAAATMGHVEAGKVLIDAGADVNRPDVSGSPALLRVVQRCGATELVVALIEGGADLTVSLPGGVTARQLAKLTGCSENAKALEAAGAR